MASAGASLRPDCIIAVPSALGVPRRSLVLSSEKAQAVKVFEPRLLR